MEDKEKEVEEIKELWRKLTGAISQLKRNQ